MLLPAINFTRLKFLLLESGKVRNRTVSLINEYFECSSQNKSKIFSTDLQSHLLLAHRPGWLRMRSFGGGGGDLESISWCIKAIDDSTLVTDSSVPLMHHDPSNLGSLSS